MEALSTRAESVSKSGCHSVLAHLNTLFNQMSQTKPSAIIRKSVATDFFQRYGGLYSTKSCFSCLCRAPEHMMSCRHTICDTCVVIYGMPSRSAEYHYDLKHCPLCNDDVQMTVRQLPPTKGPLILSLDGGGIRGIIQLGLLRSLEHRIGGGITIPQIFDLCAGTSVGNSVAYTPVLSPHPLSNIILIQEASISWILFSTNLLRGKVFTNFRSLLEGYLALRAPVKSSAHSPFQNGLLG